MGCCFSSPPSDARGYRPATSAPTSKTGFANKPASAIGDAAIPQERRVTFGIVLPEVAEQRPVWMFFDKSKPVEKVIAGACAHAGLKLDKGKLVGSPERLNLFTVEGDVVRLDLEIEAHLGSTLQPRDTLIVEKGNRLEAAQLARGRF